MSSADAARDLGDQRAALHRYVTRLVSPDLHQAEDIVQETLLRAWQHAGQLDWAERPIRQWLFRIARNLVVDAWRKDRSVPIGIAADLFPERADRSDLAEAVADRQLLLHGLRQLPARHREILFHVHLLGRGGDDTAHALGIPRGTVKSRTHHALRAMRVALEEAA